MEEQSNTYSSLNIGELLAGRGWTFRATLSQESSEPVSPQGVCVGTQVKGLFRSHYDSQHMSAAGFGLGIGLRTFLTPFLLFLSRFLL